MNLDQEKLQILTSGSTSVFWLTLRDCLLSLKAEAIEELILAAPEKVAEISELQQMVRVVHQIVGLVEGARAELDTLETGGSA